jgi:hypothetical protein
MRRSRPIQWAGAFFFLAMIVLVVVFAAANAVPFPLAFVLYCYLAFTYGRMALSSVTVSDHDVVVRNNWRTYHVPIEDVDRILFRSSTRYRFLRFEPFLRRSSGEDLRLDGLVSMWFPRMKWIEQAVITLNSAIQTAKVEQALPPHA